jgi:hypothetical protein
LQKSSEAIMSQDVTKVETQLPATLDYSKYAGQGTEQATAGDYALPFLTILQKLSPQVDADNLLYVEGAKAGMVFETASGQLFDGKAGLMVIPCYFRKDLVEWKLRESGGGFVKSCGWNEELINSCTRNDRGQMILPNGNMLVDTKYEYCLVITESGPIQVVISFTSTQLKKSRKWLSMRQMRKMTTADGRQFIPPSFAFSYKFTTGQESNEKGTWYGWQIEAGPVQDNVEIAHMAIKFHNAIAAGNVKLSDPDAGLKADADIPF